MQEPELEGRQVVTFHNQRDFIFVRHHRYIYKKSEESNRTRARLQELGPRFTLRMRWLMNDVFDPEHGEYEWINKRKETEGNRKKFYL